MLFKINFDKLRTVNENNFQEVKYSEDNSQIANPELDELPLMSYE